MLGAGCDGPVAVNFRPPWSGVRDLVRTRGCAVAMDLVVTATRGRMRVLVAVVRRFSNSANVRVPNIGNVRQNRPEKDN